MTPGPDNAHGRRGRTHEQSRAPFALFRTLWWHLSPRRKKQFFLVLGVILLSAVSEIVTLGAFVPFAQVLFSAGGEARLTELYARVQPYAPFLTMENVKLWIFALFCAAAIVAGLVRLAMVWSMNRLSFMFGYEMEVLFFNQMIYAEYHAHIRQHSSEVFSILEKSKLISAALAALLNTFSGAIISLTLIFSLVYFAGWVAFGVIVFLAFSYFLMTLLVKRHLMQNSRVASQDRDKRMKIVQESFGGFRDVLIYGLQSYYAKVFRKRTYSLNSIIAQNTFVRQSPRIFIELIVIVLFSVLISVYYYSGKIGALVGVLALLALALQRMLPNIHNMYTGWAFIKSNADSLSSVFEKIRVELEAQPGGASEGDVAVSFDSSIRFDDVGFRYGPDEPWVFRKVNLTLPKGAVVGIAGGSGAGKSTLLDLATGLLEPVEGRILVDERPLLRSQFHQWRQLFSFVSQDIFLIDGSFADNIGLVDLGGDIDMDRVRTAAEVAQIHEYIEGLEGGYEANVGERGVKLSGGQRQRIALARAIYKKAELLVLDEVTSALDMDTEERVVRALQRVYPDMTVLIVSHRPTIMENCHAVYSLAGNGALAEERPAKGGRER